MLAAIYEVIKHCFRKACCRPSGVKRTRNTGINTDRTGSQETGQTGQTWQTGHCIWITTASGKKFHNHHTCRRVGARTLTRSASIAHEQIERPSMTGRARLC